MTQEMVIKQKTGLHLLLNKRTLLRIVILLSLFIGRMASAQTVISNETFPNQFNTAFGSNNQTNGTFAGSTGTWTASCNSNSLSAIAVIQAYYSPVTNAIKIVNWNTNGKGAADCHATSPTVSLSHFACSPNINFTFKLYTYTCSASDPTSFFKLEFSADNGTTWAAVYSKSSADLYNTYGTNGLTTITVPVAANYRVSGFKYRFSGYKPANQCNNFYLFVDDAKMTASACSSTGSIGDRVWLDANGNGLQDASETAGITGVTVQLWNSTGTTLLATTSTNGSGSFVFSGLASGNYKIKFPLSLSGSVVTSQNVGTNTAIDSDPSQSTGFTNVIVLNAGQTRTDADAGYSPVNLSLGNRVWNDANNNGINENTENGIASVTVNLYKDDNNDNYPDTTSTGADNVLATKTTDASGYYLFTNLSPGNYVVGVLTPSGFVKSTINGGDPDNDINSDNNGIYSINTGETRGWAITLIANTENDCVNTNTNSNLTYDFGFTAASTCNTYCSNSLLTNSSGYFGGFEIVPNSLNLGPVSNPNPAGSELTLITSGNISADKCIIATNGNSIPGGINLAPHSGHWLLLLHPKRDNERLWFKTVSVTPGTTYNFCAWGAGSKQTPATMTLQLFMNGVNVSSGTITNGGVWTEVCGSYTVPAGVTSMEISIKDPTAASNGISHFVALDDICFSPCPANASIAGRAWLDANANGIQDASETIVLAGITVQLWNSTGTALIATTTTNAAGNYSFNNLPAGSYTVKFPVVNNGTALTASHIGTNTGIDSDPSQTSGFTQVITLSNGQNVTNIDGGYVPNRTNPDFNSTFVNIPVTGNVRTNDNVPSGTTYGTSPTLLSSPAGSIPVLTMNSNGTYSFVSNLPGVYTYDVPVCVPGLLTPCPPTKLVITVLDAFVNSNAPVANVDITTTKINTPVTLKTLANDAAGNAANILVPSTVTVTVPPLHGTTSVNTSTGDITYTPAAGYSGTDTLTYQVCDNQAPSKCATAKQIITILPAVSNNTTAAADDYKITPFNTAATGNVKVNDIDAEGNTQTVSPQTTTIAGKGTLVLAADGSYTFTPVNGFSGPVEYPYTTCDNGTPQACANATLHILVRPPSTATNPDFNSTFVNIPVTGNVQTNDNVPSGTTYGTSPTLLSSPAGSIPVLTMNSNGTYSFVSNLPGVYTYDVPVCVPGQSAPCPPTKLVITVLDAFVNSNAPVANVDITTTKINTPVTLKTLANDAAGNAANILVPSTVTVTVPPLHGTTSVNTSTGDITYTPAAGYSGTDTLTYQVCDNQAPSKCATAKQIITILPAVSNNTTAAADDYKITPFNTAATGNVKVNDTDAEGNTQTVSPQTTTIAGKGTLVLAADGSYTFTPVNGFSGPVEYPYTTCDNGTPQACANATLHILVRPPSTATNPDFNATYVNIPVSGNVSTNDQVPAGTTYGTSPVLTSSPAGSNPVLVMNSNGTYNFVSDLPGVYKYNVPVCVPGQTAPCPPTELTITVLGPTITTNSPVANVDIVETKINTPVILRTLANDQPGNSNTLLNPASVVVTVAPLHGTTSINPATGDNTYTPNPGYTGTDTLTYQVCDNQVPPKCATAKQIITIKPAGSPNTTSAADDYNTTPVNTPVSGNVKTNDTDAEGNAQTVTAQTTVIPGKGTLVLASNGTYTFTPAADFTGPVEYPYTTCDNGTPQACANATLHILVSGVPDLTPRITLNPNNIIGPSSQEVTVQVNEINRVITNGSTITMYVDKLSFYSNFNYDPTRTTNSAGQAVQNNLFTIDATSNPDFYIITTNAQFANSLRRLVFTVTVDPGQTKGATNVNVYLDNGSGGEVNFNNNNDFTTLTFSFPVL